MVLPDCCHLSVGIIARNCRRKVNVHTVPRGWGSIVTNDWRIRRRCFFKKINNLTFDLALYKIMPRDPLHHVTYAPANVKLLCPTGQEEMYLQ